MIPCVLNNDINRINTIIPNMLFFREKWGGGVMCSKPLPFLSLSLSPFPFRMNSVSVNTLPLYLTMTMTRANYVIHPLPPPSAATQHRCK